MGWKLKTLGGATTIGLVGAASATPDMIAVGKAGIAAHTAGSTVASKVIEAGLTGSGHAFWQVGKGAYTVAHPIVNALIATVGHATGLTAAVTAGASLGLVLVTGVIAVGACWLVGKLLKKMWDKAHGKGGHEQQVSQRQMPPERQPGLGRSAEKQHEPGLGTEALPTAAQTLPRAQGQYQGAQQGMQ